MVTRYGGSAVFDLIWLVPALPFAASMAIFASGRRIKDSGVLASAVVGASFVVSLILLFALLGHGSTDRAFERDLWSWIHVGSFSVDVDLRIDPLSIVMALVVSGVGCLIHVYAIGYMRNDPRYDRFFAPLNLFVFFMLLLVLADNFLLLYVGWEGVGLCSYLLIGHWHERPAAAAAAKKAFIVTRIGDAAFLVGIAMIFTTFHSLDFSRTLSLPGRQHLPIPPLSAVTYGFRNSVTVIALLLL